MFDAINDEYIKQVDFASQLQTSIYGLFDQYGVLRYIGKTSKTLEHRLKVHIRHATEHNGSNQTHRCRWIRKCLTAGYTPVIKFIERVDGNGADKEKFWVKKFKEDGFNLINATDGGEGLAGYKHTQAFKDKMSKDRKGILNVGRKHSQEEIDKRERTLSKIRITPKYKEKMRLSHIGKTCMPDTKEKIRTAHLKLWKNPEFVKKHNQIQSSPECKEKKRRALLGKKQSPENIEKRKQALIIACNTPAFKEKMRLKGLGVKLSQETKDKISLANTGKKRTEEQLQNMRQIWATPEYKEKKRQLALGRKQTSEAKEKIRLAVVGRKHSMESRIKMRKKKSPQAVQKMIMTKRVKKEHIRQEHQYDLFSL